MKVSKDFSWVNIIFLLAFLLIGCDKITRDTPKVDDNVLLSKDGVKIVVEDRSPEIPFAKVRFASPENGMVIEGENVFVKLEVSDFVLGVQTQTTRSNEIANSSKGQHIHLIVDNKPYYAIYSVGKPFNVEKLEPGAHSILAFPSRSYHESVKTPGASDVLNFYVGEKAGEFTLTKKTPSIIYSRPKGEYKGEESKKIMLDFYLNNIELSPTGYKARYTISKKDGTGNVVENYVAVLDQWKPAFVTGLSTGKYFVALELLDKKGMAVPGFYNRTEREITVIN